MKKILIINYGMGNIKSVGNAISELGREYTVSDLPEDIIAADAFILPGVGGFNQAMENLKKRDLVLPLQEQVLGKSKPILGICLGMQLFAGSSTEKTNTQGLGWINGDVRQIQRFPGIRLPHVGWNEIHFSEQVSMFKNIQTGANFYFDHSYHLYCDEDDVTAWCDYGNKIVAAIRKNNIFGTQFHPEKSQINGLRLFNNFLRFIDDC